VKDRVCSGFRGVLMETPGGLTPPPLLPVFLILIMFSPASILNAKDTAVKRISDDSRLRRTLAGTLFTEPPEETLRRKPRTETLESGEKVRISAAKTAAGEFSVILARERDGHYPGWAQGSCIVTRSIETGELVRIRVYLMSNPNAYIEFSPLDNGKSAMDAVLYNALITQGLPLPYSLNRLLELPVSDILTGLDYKKARYFEPDPGNYRDTRILTGKIREAIKNLEYADDGATDENGNYVFIETLLSQNAGPGKAGLNCSGFAKWIADGLVSPVTGRGLKIESLKAPFGERGSAFTAPFEKKRAPFFGLDWIRNLASETSRVFNAPSFGTLRQIEIREAPFSAVIDRKPGANRENSVRAYPGYLDNAGFGIEGLQALLYILAIDEPYNFFLGAVNNVAGTPPLRTFFHIAAFFPYFDENGVFHIAVFESAAENPFSKFRNRYPAGTYINLCRVPVSVNFTPKT